MTYEASDQSVHDGSPITCFKFIGTGGIYRYTDADEEVTVNGEKYFPLEGIERGTIEIGSVIDSIMTMDITLPVECDVAQRFALLRTPDNLDVEIREVHRGTNYATEWKMKWKGYTIGYSTSGRTTTVQTGTVIQAALAGEMNSVYFQTACNHTLYDARCKVIKSEHTTLSIVTAIDGNELTVADDGVANNALRAGEIRNLRTDERRFILSNALNQIDIGFPFDDLILGDEVELVKGCIHSFGECNVKFNNIPNFGGFMYVPTKNPFEEGI